MPPFSFQKTFQKTFQKAFHKYSDLLGFVGVFGFLDLLGFVRERWRKTIWIMKNWLPG